jgi:hypothetical protein
LNTGDRIITAADPDALAAPTVILLIALVAGVGALTSAHVGEL